MDFNKIIPSNDNIHKFMIILRRDGKTKVVRFGAVGYEHFTSGHLDEARRQRYVDRHKKNEKWNNERSAAYYAFNFLWRFKTYNEAKKWIYNDLKSKGYN